MESSKCTLKKFLKIKPRVKNINYKAKTGTKTPNKKFASFREDNKENQKLQQEAQVKSQLMEQEFQYNMQLKGIEVEGLKMREKEKEDRKDLRTKIQATQQSELIDQRNTGKAPKNFESAGNDILSGGFDLGSFDPR